MGRLALAILFLFGIAWSQNVPLHLKPGDSLDITVFGHHEYSGAYTIQSDGAIYATGIGRVAASGKTVGQVETEIKGRLGRLVLRPDVSVILLNERRLVVYVVGGRPGPDKGVVAYDSNLDLRKLFAQAAPEVETDLLTMSIFRDGKVIQTVDPQKLIGNSSSEWDGPLMPDDVVVINPVPFIRVWVLGSVRKPGEVVVREGGDVYRAIAEAGDLNLSLTTSTVPGEPGPRLIREDFTVTVRRGPDLIRVSAAAKPGEPPVQLQSGDTVFVDEQSQMRITVLGEVKRPGEQILTSNSSIALAITDAGGPTDYGSLKNLYLYRNGEMTTINALDENGELKTTGPALQPGDMLMVPLNKRNFYVFGEVNAPGRKIMDDRRVMRLADALSSGGGINGRGTNRRIVVLRPNAAGKMVPTRYNFDEYAKDGKLSANPEIQPGDVVYVGTPQGLNFASIVQIASAALIIEGAKAGIP